MTEAEWLACNEPKPMLKFLYGQRRRVGTLLGRVSAWLGRPPYEFTDRKLRLFICGWCRLHWHLFVDGREQRAIEIAELHADGQASERELRAASEAARNREQLPSDRCYPHGAEYVAEACLAPLALHGDPWDYQVIATLEAVGHVVGMVFNSAAPADHVVRMVFHSAVPARTLNKMRWSVWEAVCAEKYLEAAVLLREVIGNPFQVPRLDPSWRAWNGSMVLNLAQAAYDDRLLPAGTLNLDRLAVLADALEEAGCDSADILSHLRGAGPHVRGCWALDLLLGKE